MLSMWERVEELRRLRRYEPRSLKDFCLKSISRNIALYNAAFSASEEANLRRDLHFLRRRYSSYLISKLSGGFKLEESYWNFLINEHVEELDFRILSKGNRDVLLSRITEMGRGLQKVVFQFDGKCFDRPTISFVNDVVRRIPNVKELKFLSCCDNETLKMLPSSCPELKVLAIDVGYPQHSEVDGLFQQKKNTVEEGDQDVRSARIRCFDYFEKGITFLLQNMPLLEDVLYPRLQDIIYRLHKDEMNNNTLNKKYNLTVLGVCFNPTDCDRDVADTLSLLTDVCPHLKTLELWMANDSNLMLVSRLEELVDLYICENNYFNGESFENKPYLNMFLRSKGGTLRKLRIIRYYISVDVLVQSCRALEELSLSEVELLPFDQNVALEPLRNLRSLSIEQMSFRDHRLNQQFLLEILKCCPKLEALHFGYCQFGSLEEIAPEISKLFESSVLQRLRFNSCHNEDELLQPIISTCSTLTEIFVEDGYMLRFD